jgi:hypothetical protein
MLLLHRDGHIPHRPPLTGGPEPVTSCHHAQDGAQVETDPIRAWPHRHAPGRPASWLAVASGHIHQIWTAAAAVLDLEHATAQIRG